MTKLLSPSRPLASSLVALCLLGLAAGCNSSSSNEAAPGQVSPRLKKIQDAKSKVDPAKK